MLQASSGLLITLALVVLYRKLFQKTYIVRIQLLSQFQLADSPRFIAGTNECQRQKAFGLCGSGVEPRRQLEIKLCPFRFAIAQMHLAKSQRSAGGFGVLLQCPLKGTVRL